MQQDTFWQDTMKNIAELKKTYGEIIEEAAVLYKLDPCVLAGLIFQESSGNPAAISPCGAIGLTQVMANTAKYRGYSLVTPKGQIYAGADYLAYVLKNFAGGDITKALAGYNAGPGRIKGDKWKQFKETREYVPRVLKYAEEYRRLTKPPELPVVETSPTPKVVPRHRSRELV